MGDTGSMLSGFSLFILSLLFIQSYEKVTNAMGNNYPPGATGLLKVIALFFLPVFDAIRVFALRLSKGISPLKADRRHLHYYMLDAGMDHKQSAWVLIMINIVGFEAALACIALHSPIWLMLLCQALPSVTASIIASKMRKKNA
jgi:UDP-GlcNAc:undecaprenyl-phosphate GlcNAc-1-phosphate transferase